MTKPETSSAELPLKGLAAAIALVTSLGLADMANAADQPAGVAAPKSAVGKNSSMVTSSKKSAAPAVSKTSPNRELPSATGGASTPATPK